LPKRLLSGAQQIPHAAIFLQAPVTFRRIRTISITPDLRDAQEEIAGARTR
jgi:hypothetical protein